MKRKFLEDYPTPHPSSSTICPSSPPNLQRQVLPSCQYARPSVGGQWFSIGRSSISCELALPSNNRLVSRIHAKIRYLEQDQALEVWCIGWNGLSVNISGTTICVRRDKQIVVQVVDSEDLIIDIAGSTVAVILPVDDTESPEDVGPMPSSPVLQNIHQDNAIAEQPVRTLADLLDIVNSLEPLSPLPSSNGMMTPSATPNHKRIKIFEDALSPIGSSTSTPSKRLTRSASTHGSSASVMRSTMSHRHSTWNCSSTRNAANLWQDQKLGIRRELFKGKENIMPLCDAGQIHTESLIAAGRALPRSRSHLVVSPSRQAPLSRSHSMPIPPIDEPRLVDQLNSIDQINESDANCKDSSDVFCSSPIQIATYSESIEQETVLQSLPVKNAATTETASQIDAAPCLTLIEATDEIIECSSQKCIPSELFVVPTAELSPDTNATKPGDEAARDEFIDMILTALASSPLSPTPLTYLIPFFSPSTTQEDMQSLLRKVECIGQVERQGRDADGKQLRSEWYYAPEHTNQSRKVRLSSLLKPIRSTRKSHKQYFWKPVHLQKPVSATGLVESSHRKKGKGKSRTGAKARKVL